MKIFRSQLRQELTVMARNGEQLLLLVVIPIMLLIFFAQTDFLPTNSENKIDFLMPGILGLAVMSTAMVSLGIATGFERSYGVLKRLGTTPLGTRRLILAKVVAICVIEIAQLVLLIFVGQLLGWNPSRVNLAQVLVLLLIGTSCFAGIGLTLAGRLRAEINLAAQNGLYLVLLLLGGIFASNDELPKTLGDVAQVLPSSLLSSLLRNSFNNNELVITDAIALGGWALSACALAVISFKWSD
ncbi:MAG: ABC transporter permease [Actinomycetota bacterium]|nr:ABC transporter permease [Actinomycetota bacterium]